MYKRQSDDMSRSVFLLITVVDQVEQSGRWVCMSRQQLLNEITFELDVWCDG